MFDLEKAIAEWRRQMEASGIRGDQVLHELENHLREEIERQVKSGMDAEAAFESATQKVGAAESLKIEFEKATKEMRAVKEARIAQGVSLVVIGLFAIYIAMFLVLKKGAFSEVSLGQQISGFTALALMLIFGFAGLHAHKFFPAIGRKQVRDMICASTCMALVAWWTIFFWVILPRFEYTLGQLCIATVWGFTTPFGIMLGLCTSIENAARKSLHA